MFFQANLVYCFRKMFSLSISVDKKKVILGLLISSQLIVTIFYFFSKVELMWMQIINNKFLNIYLFSNVNVKYFLNFLKNFNFVYLIDQLVLTIKFIWLLGVKKKSRQVFWDTLHINTNNKSFSSIKMADSINHSLMEYSFKYWSFTMRFEFDLIEVGNWMKTI